MSSADEQGKRKRSGGGVEKFRDEGVRGLGCGINSAVEVCERGALERDYRG